MIRIGLTGWGDHAELYRTPAQRKETLPVYSGYFPVVEVDSSFYAIQPIRNYERWVQQTPDSFTFIIKAYQGMTGHQRGALKEGNSFEAFLESIQPVAEAGKLAAVLCQYPPWFDCTRENVEALRRAKEQLADMPAALEFRNQTWFEGERRAQTLTFMQQEGWIHSICDEPQAGIGSVPTVLHPTHPELTIVRFHGRNSAGWQNTGSNWREVRYLYHYSEQELTEWVEHLRHLQAGSRQVIVLFNNNSGGHAAGNALDLMRLLGMEHQPLPGPEPEQLELF